MKGGAAQPQQGLEEQAAEETVAAAVAESFSECGLPQRPVRQRGETHAEFRERIKREQGEYLETPEGQEQERLRQESAYGTFRETMDRMREVSAPPATAVDKKSPK